MERPLRIEGIDPERTHTAKEIKAFKDEGRRSEAAPPVIRKVHKSVEPDSLRGLFSATIRGKPAVVEYEPDTDLRDTEQVPLTEDGGIEAFLLPSGVEWASCAAWQVPSGTTIIAAERQDRTCYAMELEPRYVDACVLQITGRVTQGDTKKSQETLEATVPGHASRDRQRKARD